MPIESSIVGLCGAPMVSDVDSRWTMAYAAALGDAALPCYMDTTRGVIAHPLFPVCFEWPVIAAMRALFDKSTSLTRDEAMRGVHATHDAVLYRAIRPPERLTTRLTVAGVERRKPGAYVVTRLDTVDDAGKPVCTSWYGSIYRGVDVVGPDARAKLAPAPSEPLLEEGEPLIECQVDVPAGMAHIYTECARIFNPIHTDASVARAAGLREIILHGTATLAMAVSRVVESEAGKDPARVERVAARFGAMVTMPSTLTVRVLAREDSADSAVIFFETLSGEGRLAIRDGIVVLRASR
ncbi:MAG TPA: MaoC/PaaZ C-terminal domain-containing protein [Candidatus Acidoferrum sp.]|nr:MaoC/PaaZ C-terminal domain-containing protein [Candidatus Acidoferrum sp.]